MSYGEKYKMYFYWDHNSSNSLYKLSFFKEGYASTVTELIPTENPCSITCPAQRDVETAIIQGTELTCNFLVDKANVAAIDADLLETYYKEMIVKLIHDPDGTPVVKWVGFLKQENASRDFYGYKYSYQISATDGLADLKDYLYSSTGTENGSPYTGFEDMLTILKNAISKIASITEFQFNWRVQLGTFSNLMSSTENALKENEIVQDMFFDLSDTGYKFNTCYDVIEKILTPFNCTFKQSGGYYWIVCTSEPNSYFYEYNWALVQQSRTASNLAIDATDFDLFGRGQLYKISPLAYYYVTLYNKEYLSSFLSNGNFDANITGWSNGRASDGTKTWSTFAWYDYPLIGGTLGVSMGGVFTPDIHCFKYTSAISLSVGAGSNVVSVSFYGELYSETRSGGASAMPIVRARIYNATDGYATGTIGQMPFGSVSGFYSFSDSFNLSAFTQTNNYLEIEVEIQDPTTTAIQLYFDNIGVSQISDDSPRDWFFSGGRTGYAAREKMYTSIYLGEKQESISDICSIKDSGGSYVVDWDRYGETDGLSIISILQQQKLNEYSSYKNYVKCMFYDPSETLNLHNFIDLDGVVYKIIGITKDYREGTVEVDMKQLGLTDVSANLTAGYKLSTQYGD